jgi:putative membrane protein
MKGKPMKKRAVGWALAAAVALTPVMAWANAGREGFSGHGNMMGGGYMFYGPVMMILVLAAIIAIVVLIVRWMGGGGQSTPAGKSPQDILKERYARGEMTTKEFEERRKVLGD